LGGSLSAQTLVVDRGLPSVGGAPHAVERGAGKGFFGDSFQVGAKGEVWVLDTIRVWAAPGVAPACPKAAGELVEKMVLLGALDNPRVPGQPACACHALIRIAGAEFRPGASGATDPQVKVVPEGSLWRVDFGNLRWSVPGGVDILYAVRATDRSGAPAACAVEKSWSLSGSAAPPGWRLFTFDKDALEDGFGAENQPRWFNLLVWAHRGQ